MKTLRWIMLGLATSMLLIPVSSHTPVIGPIAGVVGVDVACAQDAPLFINGDCSGVAWGMVAAGVATAIALLAAARWAWKWALRLSKITPLGIALSVVTGALAAMGLFVGSISVLWAGKCSALSLDDLLGF